MCRAWEPTPTPASLDRRAPTRPVLWGTRAGSAVRDRERYFTHSGSPRPGPVRPHQYGAYGCGRAAPGVLSGCGGLAGCRGRNGGCGGPGRRPAHGWLAWRRPPRGHAPTGRSSLPGVAEAELDGVGGVGNGADDPPGHGPLGQEPLVIIQDLLAGVDPQVALSTRAGPFLSVQAECLIDPDPQHRRR